jgi:hypothetical protein
MINIGTTPNRPMINIGTTPNRPMINIGTTLAVEAALGKLTKILTEPDVPLAAAQAAGDELYRYFT